VAQSERAITCKTYENKMVQAIRLDPCPGIHSRCDPVPARRSFLRDGFYGSGQAFTLGERHSLRSVSLFCLYFSAARLDRGQDERKGVLTTIRLRSHTSPHTTMNNDKRIFAFVSLGLLLTACIAPFFVAASGHDGLAICLGAVAGLLGLLFGALSGSDRIGRTVTIALLFILIFGVGGSAVIYAIRNEKARTAIEESTAATVVLDRGGGGADSN
jgi:hypothetical protein